MMSVLYACIQKWKNENYVTNENAILHLVQCLWNHVLIVKQYLDKLGQYLSLSIILICELILINLNIIFSCFSIFSYSIGRKNQKKLNSLFVSNAVCQIFFGRFIRKI